MLRTVHATRYVTPFREGGSLPALVEGDDLGLYVLKFRGAWQGPLALAAEIIAGEIGRVLGLRVPELVLFVADAGHSRQRTAHLVRALAAADHDSVAVVIELAGVAPFKRRKKCDGCMAALQNPPRTGISQRNVVAAPMRASASGDTSRISQRREGRPSESAKTNTSNLSPACSTAARRLFTLSPQSRARPARTTCVGRELAAATCSSTLYA